MSKNEPLLRPSSACLAFIFMFLAMDSSLIVQEATSIVSGPQSEESFAFPCSSNDGCVAFDKDRHTDDELKPNHDRYEQELYFDIDVTLPFKWKESLCTTSHLVDSSDCLQGIREFEFSITLSDIGAPSSNGFLGAFSPADDLFYKGRLLPLQLPPRLHMVEQLSSLESSNTAEDESGEEDYGSLDANGDSDVFTPSIIELIDKQRLSFSCQGSIVDEVYRLKEPDSTTVMSSGAWVDMTRVQDASVFPDCYKDPTLQMLQGGVSCVGAKGNAKPSIGWKVFLPGYGRLSCRKLAVWQDSCPGCDVRKAKDAQGRGGFSDLKLRASASFFKSLLLTGELGRLLVHRKGHYRLYREANQVETAVEENGAEEEGGSFANCTAHLAMGIDKQPLHSGRAQEEEDKLAKKARGYLRKYVRLIKSMYVAMSHTKHEQSRSSQQSFFTVEDARNTDCRFSTCTAKNHGTGNMDHKPVRTTSLSRRPRTNGDSMVADVSESCRLQKAGGAYGSGAVNGSACLNTENAIQGAIAHCKQSSSLPR